MKLDRQLLDTLVSVLLDDLSLAREDFLSLSTAARTGRISMDECVERNSKIFLNTIPKVGFTEIALSTQGVLYVSPEALELIEFWKELFESYQNFCHEQN